MSQWCNDGKEISSKQRDAPAKLLFVNINTLFFAVLLDVAVVVGFVVVQKQCYPGNVTSHFSSPLYSGGISWGNCIAVPYIFRHCSPRCSCHMPLRFLNTIYIFLLFFQPLAFLNLLYNTSTPSLHSVVCRYDILLASVVKGSSYRLRAVFLFLHTRASYERRSRETRRTTAGLSRLAP